MSNQSGDQHQQQYVSVSSEIMNQQQHQVANPLTSVAPPTSGYPAFDLGKFWTEQMHMAENFVSDFKTHPLPLARIKKVMKTDQEVKMISAEAPILFAKGCEIFITELTKRAWVHAEENKRRTLQRSDIATAISKTDMCDFLIDIVPREEAVKSQSTAYEQQPAEYSGYYSQGAVPQYAPQQTMEYASYPQLTPEQMQQYQLQLQQFAAQQQQQQQQQSQSQPPQQPTQQYESSAQTTSSNKTE